MNKHIKTTMSKDFAYPSINFDGKPIHMIDRRFNNKLDFLKVYTEEMLKLSNMRRKFKKWLVDIKNLLLKSTIIYIINE